MHLSDPSSRPSPEVQKDEIENIILTMKVKEGESWYLVNKKWLVDWENYVTAEGDTQSPPGPIDNSSLVDGEHALLAHIEEDRHYDLIAEEAWNLLFQWYGGGPKLERKAIKIRGKAIVEVRPLSVDFCHKTYGTVTKSVSKGDSIGEIKKSICERFNLDATKMEVVEGDTGLKITDMTRRVGELGVSEGTKIYVDDSTFTIGEKSDDDSRSSSGPSYASSSSSSYLSSYTPYSSYSPYSYDSPKKQTSPGIVGLSNLGNTCFMNSSLQCLSNTVPLAEFFLTGAYVNDINSDNPLGTSGKLVKEFSKLIRELWSGKSSSVTPRDFKRSLEEFAPQFSGYQQHDSQELLAFLLDGLHEDLNRVKKKPYLTLKEGDDIPDSERVQEAWTMHQQRNNSVIVDWFHALLKSTLVCPDCNRVSVTFDPFMYLSLPLPAKIDRDIPLVLVTANASVPPTKYLVKVNKGAIIESLKKALGDMAGVNPDNLIITDVFNSKFFKKYHNNESIDGIDEDRDVIYAYELGPATTGATTEQEAVDNSKLVHCAVYLRKEERRSSYSLYHPTTSFALFGTPFFVSVPSTITYRELYSTINTAVSRWLHPEKPRVTRVNSDKEEEDGKDEVVVHDLENGSQKQRQSRRQLVEEEEEGIADADSISSEEEDTLSDDGADSGSSIRVLSSSEDTSPAFTIVSVDTHCYHDQTLPDNDGPLDLENCTLCLTWKLDKLDMFDETKFKAFQLHPSCRAKATDDDEAITLDKCLKLYTTVERLGPEDPWYCNKCKDFKQATKKFDLWSVPRILVIHLKRFSYRNKYFREKLETLVSFPLRDLDLSRHIKGANNNDPAPIYDLYAVSNHYGSLGGGHYTAYALNKGSGKWYKFDDSYVTEIDSAQVISSNAYVLFYQRRDTLSMSYAPPTNDTNGNTNNSTTATNNIDGKENVESSNGATNHTRNYASHMDLD